MMKTETAVIATLLAGAAAMPLVRAEIVHGQCNKYYSTPKPLIDDRASRSCKKIITKPLSELHDFTGKDGKRISGKIQAYDPSRAVVTIATEKRKTTKVDLNILSKADQAYVHEWHIIDHFFRPGYFRISARQRRERDMTEYLIWRPDKLVVYDITLENRCDFDMKNLTLSYRIYYRVSEPNTPEPSVNEGSKSGALNIKRLDAGECTLVETPPVRFPAEDLFEYYKGGKAPPVEFRGIRIRIYLPLESGRTARRDCYCTHRNGAAR